MMLQDFVLRNFLLIKIIFKKKKKKYSGRFGPKPSRIFFFPDNLETVSAQTVWKIADGFYLNRLQ
jgi:hypothetical protein